MTDPKPGTDPRPLEVRVLDKRRYDFEQPTSTHFTLEVAAYWNNDLLDQVESGRQRRVTVGGYTAGRTANLTVELPSGVKHFVIARLDGRRALITVPDDAQVALRQADGEITQDPPRVKVSAPFAATGVWIGFGDRIAFRLEHLTFVCEFVRSHGGPRRGWDWMIPRWLGR